MKIKFLKKYNRYEAGTELADVFQNDAEKLIADGYAEEVPAEETPRFNKHDWKTEYENQARQKAIEEMNAKAQTAKPASNAVQVPVTPEMEEQATKKNTKK